METKNGKKIKVGNLERGGESEAAEPEAGAENGEREGEKRSYYYDDAHGYEIYDPEKEDEDEDD